MKYIKHNCNLKFLRVKCQPYLIALYQFVSVQLTGNGLSGRITGSLNIVISLRKCHF